MTEKLTHPHQYTSFVSPQYAVWLVGVLAEDGIYPSVGSAYLEGYGIIPGAVSVSFTASRWHWEECILPLEKPDQFVSEAA